MASSQRDASLLKPASRIDGPPACSECNKLESELLVSLRPCHGCRDVVYCSQKCQEAGAGQHDCKRTVSDSKTFGRNCYTLRSLSRNFEDSTVTLTPLTTFNTEKLLSKSGEDLQSRQAQSRQILSRVASWNPNLVHRFGVKDGPFSEAPLRMLHAGRKSGTGEGDGTDSFIAVSYSWSNSEWSPITDFVPSRIEGKSVPISRPLWNFLLGLRESEQEGIWIDQICLDQESVTEKASAIASMDALYSTARIVFIALEDVKLTHHEVTLLSEAFYNVSSDRHWVFEPGNSQELFGIVSKIFSARWFSRAWCFHEYHMAKNRIIAIRCEALSPDVMDTVVGLVNFGDFVYCLPYFENEELRSANAETVRKMLRFFAGQGSAYSNIVANTFSYDSRYLRDRMTITINLTRLAISVNEDVAHDDDAFMSVLTLALAAGDGTILTTRGAKLRLGQNSQVVSWLQRPDETGWSSRREIPRNHGISAIDAGSIELNLYFLDELHFQGPSPAAVATAAEFLSSSLAAQISTAYGLETSPTSDTEYASQGRPVNNSILETLACGIDCGRSWMIEAWPRIEDEVGPEVDEHFSLIEHLAQTVEQSLFSEDQTGGAQPADVVKILRLVVCLLLFGKYWEIGSWFSTSVSGYSGLSDLRKEEFFRVPIPSEHKLYERAKYSFYSRLNTRLAIPQALASEEFCMSDRIWLLEPVKEDESGFWRVKDKVALIGCPSIREEGQISILKQKQRIVG